MRRRKISFIKMHGLGNDFILIDDSKKSSHRLNPALVRKLCDRRFGIGADQILWLKPAKSRAADLRMEILNADGSTAEMCGNGIRAVALYAQSQKIKPKNKKKKNAYLIETLAGLLEVEIRGKQVKVDMGRPVLGRGFPNGGESLQIQGTEVKFFEVSMGNPHAVIFVERMENARVEELGPAIETHPRFPKRTNVEFVEVKSPDTIQIRVWERGAGLTLACGTGACATAVAAIATGRVQAGKSHSKALNVDLPGGRLKISWAGEGSSVVMEGPAEEVFRGEFKL